MTDDGSAERGSSGEAPVSTALVPLSRRQARLLDVLLGLAVVGLGVVVVGMLGRIFFDFGDIILTFFLAWLLAFILSPIVRWIVEHIPRLPRVVAVVVVYLAIIVGATALIVFVAQSLVKGISEFLVSVPKLIQDLPSILAPLQDWLRGLGFGQIDLNALASQILKAISESASSVVGPLQSIAAASLGALGTTLIVVILSVYIVIDQGPIQGFFYRLAPPGQREDIRHLEQSVAHSFGGFLRGQALIGIVYAVVALVTSAILGLDFIAPTTAAAGVLMAIPFFGPFVAWAPPVIVAIFTDPGLIVPALVIMMIGWFVVMNILQPRLMAGAVGLHPIVVLASVLIGSKIAGISGAIFGIPVAAVIASLFFHYFEIFGSERTVTARAARRLEGRVGRRVRVPREPQPGVDADLDEVVQP